MSSAIYLEESRIIYANIAINVVKSE